MGAVSHPSIAIHTLSWPDIAYMYLERIPERWLSLPEVANGVRFEILDLQTPFQQWEHSQLFCSSFELRWEKMDGQFQTVLVGEAPILVACSAIEPDLDAASGRVQDLLWGRHIAKSEVAILGAEHQSDSRIPGDARPPHLVLSRVRQCSPSEVGCA